MTYQQAGRVAILKRILGWVVFIPALLSTLISLLSFVYQHSEKTKGINAVMLDFAHVIVDMLRFNTSFLNIFWYNSPVPDVEKSLFSGANLMFIIIYLLIFVGLALQASGARMSRQVKFIREGLEDQMILEQAKGSDGQTRAQLEERITLPHHTIFLQYFPLYILPTVIAVVAYFALKLLGQMAGIV
ncbi:MULTISPECIES: YniB family protein [unclassified Serratia (in: enterobacteria)]|uniref:YniB family protein n=1 Tax=unclassified Serratia (in: enterobacteria) TaxID=2647522 RepID=UPI00050791FD|nr:MULTISPECIES: YniB family protein [unclassified Serratia (in: enterobacteria)]KFK94787.1 membrane protein [Serratia sp. Ag2]KFK99053.1 membrane protein [Serratia sp. Ag1]